MYKSYVQYMEIYSALSPIFAKYIYIQMILIKLIKNEGECETATPLRSYLPDLQTAYVSYSSPMPVSQGLPLGYWKLLFLLGISYMLLPFVLHVALTKRKLS